jgi:hypothetical protein
MLPNWQQKPLHKSESKREGSHKDNIGSLRVLEKCGFTRIGQGSGFSEARGEEVEEFLLRLD